MSRKTAYIGLGSNLGDRGRFIEDALQMLGQTPDAELANSSEAIETTPLADINQPKYLNAVAELKTELSAENVHRRLIEIENSLERGRGRRWSSRNIDLDLLLFDNEIINTDTLIVPHPQMHLRSFVLSGLCRLNRKLVHPILNETVEVIAGRLNGCDFAPLIDKPRLISIAGNIGAGKTTLTKKLAEALSCRAILEAYDTNPYLPKVYAGNKELALSSQLYFLTSRVEQLNPSIREKNNPVVSDYVFQKEQIYAKLTLSKEQFTLYQKVYSQVAPGVINPALVIYLTGPPKVCLERIHKRNRAYEQKIEISFLEAIDAGYKELVAGWRLSPVITLNDFDCFDDKAVSGLAEQVKYYVMPPFTSPVRPTEEHYESRKND
ncbi:MAG: 2-amino-4-hydroxy-6-hydroxymethyldihydropteridine diphosphokinase [Sedimentisphaerales bacterium]|nr:2-amino-4-hydroxy-6-hydroxymethyldihydropteridine diphosphokinase [Sedimentisphaerales bacterium]